jgi:hypothetical protein
VGAKKWKWKLEVISSTTDEQGRVRASFTIGSDYLNIVSVTYPGTNLQVNFQVNRTRKILKIASGDNQKVKIGENVEPLTVRLEDGDGRPLPNETIIWERIQGNGELTPISETTRSFGIAAANYIMGEAKTHRIRVKFEDQEVVFNLERDFIAPTLKFNEVSVEYKTTMVCCDALEEVPITRGTWRFVFSYEDGDGDAISTDQLGHDVIWYSRDCVDGCIGNVYRDITKYSGGAFGVGTGDRVDYFHGDNHSGWFTITFHDANWRVGTNQNYPFKRVFEVTISDRAGNVSNVAVAIYD